MTALFVGLDLSTQALKASLLDADLRGLDEVQVRFDADLPQHGTHGGVLPSHHPLLDEPEAAAAPVHMYVEAMDMLWDRITSERKWPVERIAAISAAGQQHASVYWARGAQDALRSVQSTQPLHTQLGPQTFSRCIVPNWQDATTLDECEQLMQHADATPHLARTHTTPALCETTGSIAHTRFTGAQILRWRTRKPEQYQSTERITLVSNFVTSLLLAGSEAKIAPLDLSDACGMNMWDMTQHRWSDPILAFVGGDAESLAAKLGHVVVDPREPMGHVGTWLQERYRLPPSCIVCQATGDNPATLQCLTPRLGEAVVSLGTSDTVLLPSRVYAPHPQYHVFAHPASTPNAAPDATPPYFLMFVYKNGSLAREWARDTYAAGTWARFDAALEAAPEPRGTGFYWLRPEILPWDARGVHRFDEGGKRIDEFADATLNVPAMVQSQAMAFKTRIAQVLGTQIPLSRVYVVGGAAENRSVCQVLANVLGCEIARPLISGRSAETGERVPYNFCSVGAAFRARWVWQCVQDDHTPSFEKCIADARGAASDAYEVVAQPNPTHAHAFATYVDTWKALEHEAHAAKA